MLKFGLFFLLFEVIILYVNCEEYCYAVDPNPTQLYQLGSKTAYRFNNTALDANRFKVRNCEADRMWMMVRHGTRLPAGSNMKRLKALEQLRDEISRNYNKGQSASRVGGLCMDDLELLRQWHWNENITANHSKFLTNEGWDDMKNIAKRYQRDFPQILKNSYNEREFYFEATAFHRSAASLKAFVDGLFGDGAYEYVKLNTRTNDSLISPYLLCQKWIDNHDYIELKKFEKTKYFTQVLKDMSRRMGLTSVLDIEKFKDIYDMCRFEFSWANQQHSPWCAIFTPKQIDTIEYREDIEDYYLMGYGNRVNERILCELMKDLLNHTNSNNLLKVKMYSVHSATIKLLLTALGYARDNDDLRADNYAKMSQRKYRTNLLAPFSSNLVAVRYKCIDRTQTYKLKFFLNEKLIDLGGSIDGTYTLSQIQQKYKHFITADCSQYFCSCARIIKMNFVLLTFVLTSMIFFK